MIYLDYAATTKADEEVIKSFTKVAQEYYANPNSLHSLGSKTNKLINAATDQIANMLKVKPDEIIYTSGASEANNAAIFGILKYNRGKQIITTKLEHSSINEPLNYLEKQGYKIDYVNLINGKVDIEHLKELISDETILVTIAHVNSEVGIIQDIEQIAKIVKQYKKCYFHSDITQSLGKIKIDLTNIDLASASAHKIYGIKGIGFLYKKQNIDITPIIHGGKSTTIYRSGTPSAELIVSLAKALRLMFDKFDDKQEKIKILNEKLINELKQMDIHINSNEFSIKNIINISVNGIKPESLLHSLEEKNIFISTKTACATSAGSEAVLAVTNNLDYANTSVRISLSHHTTEEEINIFVKELKNSISNLRLNK